MLKGFRSRGGGRDNQPSREVAEQPERDQTPARRVPPRRARDAAPQTPNQGETMAVSRPASPGQPGAHNPATNVADMRRAPSSVPEDEAGGSRLIVGRDIQVKGEIASCDTLVVEGRVEASMDSRVIRIAESGVFIGEVGIDYADIIGRFEGKLTARKRLVIHPTGQVSGTIRYGAIQIEEGGQIMGDVQVIDGPAQGEPAKRTRDQREQPSRTNGSRDPVAGAPPGPGPA